MIKQERERERRARERTRERREKLCAEECTHIFLSYRIVFFISRSPFAAEVFLITVSFLCHEIDVLWEAVIFLNPLMLLPIKSTYNVITPYFIK